MVLGASGELVAWAVLLGDFAIRLALAVRVIMRRAPVPTSLAWLALLLFVPLLGVPLYLLIGEVRLGRRRLKRYEQVARGMEEQAAMFWQTGAQDWTGPLEQFKHIPVLATEVGGLPPLRGNRLELIAHSRDFVSRIVADIERATATCHLLFYIWAPDEEAERVVVALLAAAKRGVKCRVLVDGVGSKDFLRSGVPERMRAGGVEVREALPASPVRLLLARVDLRNHRKIVVIDGWVAFTGSHNLTDPLYGLEPKKGVGPWVDASVRIEGPAAQTLEVVFLRDWQMETDEAVRETLLAPPPEPGEGSVAQVVPTGPGPGPQAMLETLLTTMMAARKELIITTPYFVPDEATRAAMLAAAHYGVKVSLVIPEHSDMPLLRSAGRSHLQELLDGGVRVYMHTKGMLHSKTMTVDADMAVIGSANLDVRSFLLNFEITLLVYDTDFASLLRTLQVTYITDSIEIFADDWRRRPFHQRFVENSVRLLSPLL